MKNRRFVVRLSGICLVLSLVVLLMAACATPAPTTPAPTPTTPAPTPAPQAITLKGVTFNPKGQFAGAAMGFLAEKVSKRTNQLVVEWVGGPEVVAGPAIPEAVIKGVIDIGLCPPSYYQGTIPLASMLNLSLMTSWRDEVTSGANAYINELHEKAGLHYLGRAGGTLKHDSYTIVSSKKIEKSADLAKLKIGTTAPWIKPYTDSIGGTNIIIPVPDAYTSLERGVVDAFAWPLASSSDNSFWEVAKYIIEPSFYAGNVVFIVNLGKWQSLPKDLQNIMTEEALNVMDEYQIDFDKNMQTAYQKYLANGGEVVKLADTDAFLKAVYEADWQWHTKTYPDVAPKLRELLTPK